VSHCFIGDNSATGSAPGSDGLGGGVFNAGGSLALVNSSVGGNLARGQDAVSGGSAGSGLGAAIYNSDGASLTIDGGHIDENNAIGGFGGSLGGNALGGAIYAAGGNVSITQVFFLSNVVQGFNNGLSDPTTNGACLGGALYIGGGMVTVTNSVFELNF